MKKVAIVQSNYIPWKGYFDLINMVDVFVLYDDAQYTRRDWRNRNKIKTLQGLHWLTIPVDVKGKYFQKISETKVADPGWAKHHWTTIVHSYSKAAHFNDYREHLEGLYLGCHEEYLSRVNFRFLAGINDLLGIRTQLRWSSDFALPEGKTEKLLSICKELGATEYVSGPAARGYLDEPSFTREGIAVTWMDYSGYPQYEQLYPPFEHGVSIIDLLCNAGKLTSNYMRSLGLKDDTGAD